MAEGEAGLADAEKELKVAETALGGAREERVRCEGLRDQAQQSETMLAAHIKERLDCAPESALATVGIEPGEELPSTEDARARFERLTRERDTMGPVNLVAESEAVEVEARLAGLIHEREDLTGAIARLRPRHQRAPEPGRARAPARLCFTQVNEHFTELFVRLFGGGRAYLKLDRSAPAEGEESFQGRRIRRSARSRPRNLCEPARQETSEPVAAIGR